MTLPGKHWFHNVYIPRISQSYPHTDSSHQTPELIPVILIPGFGGSALRAELNETRSPAWYCYRHSGWFRIWVALQELLTQVCWFENLRLSYNVTSNEFSSVTGVVVHGIDFGGVEGIDYLERLFGFPFDFTSYFGTFVKSLEYVGYIPGFNLRGIPYDWRMPTYSHERTEGLYSKLKTLIEETYELTRNKRVAVITHSFGGVTFLNFLNYMDNIDISWKSKYIHSFIPMSAPWRGSPKTVRALISGDDFGFNMWSYSLVDKVLMRNVSRTYGGLISLLPDTQFWSNFTFIQLPERNYTGLQLKELLADAQANISHEIFPHTQDILSNLEPPGVPTFCLFGCGIPTEISYVYPDLFSDPVYIDNSDMGDGTVPLISLEKCRDWNNSTVVEFPFVGHQEILQDTNVIEHVLDILSGFTQV